MKQETAKETTKEVATFAAGGWGAGEHFETQDIVLSKILLMQKMSKLLDSIEAKEGDFIDSLSHEVLKTPEIIVFDSFKTWALFEDGKFKGTEAVTAQNANWAWHETLENGIEIQRHYTYNFYCLLVNERIGKEPPYVISLKRTSLRTGKRLMMDFLKLKNEDKPSAAVVLSLLATKQTNDKGSFYVVDYNVKRNSSQAELGAAYSWYQILRDKKDNVIIDDSDLQKEEKPEVVVRGENGEVLF